jgi:hypothetical protein
MKKCPADPHALLQRINTQRSSSSAFTLMEVTAAMLILLLVAGILSFGSASMERAISLYDTYSALTDELNRQAERARNIPMARLVAACPIAGGGEGVSPWGPPPPSVGTEPPAVMQLSGFLPDPTAGPRIPTVQWRRLRSNYSSFQSSFQDMVEISITHNQLGTTLSNSTTVLRLFDAGQQQ